jgi:hypothetical protein
MHDAPLSFQDLDPDVTPEISLSQAKKRVPYRTGFLDALSEANCTSCVHDDDYMSDRVDHVSTTMFHAPLKPTDIPMVMSRTFRGTHGQEVLSTVMPEVK